MARAEIPRCRHELLTRARAENAGYTAVLVVPTGIGAAIGGYAGDAMPVAHVFSSIADTLVTHPNVVNAGSLYWPKHNVLYVEGFALDLFARGELGLRPRHKKSNQVGLVLDCGMTEEEKLRHVQVAHAARATLGIHISDIVETDAAVGVNLKMSPGGASWGTVERPDTLLRAARQLVSECGCNAVAVVTKFPEDEDEEMLEAYRHGHGVDAIGGAEALISHLITQNLKVPCAHAPALLPLDVDKDVSPRACAEELGYTFLPCVLANLRRAPLLVSPNSDGTTESHCVWASDVDAIIVPETACGGSAVLSFCRHRTLVIVVEENRTGMKATPGALRLDQIKHRQKCDLVRVRSYLEAAGVLAAHKEGFLPSCLSSESTKPNDHMSLMA